MQLDGEAETLGVERDRRIDVVDDVADADSGQFSLPGSQRSTVGRHIMAGPLISSQLGRRPVKPTPKSL
jgi:hypothetical protein